MLEVQPDMITVLADTAIRAHDLDEAKALEAKKRAEEALANRQAEMDYAAAEAELAKPSPSCKQFSVCARVASSSAPLGRKPPDSSTVIVSLTGPPSIVAAWPL
jgi:hypothetical protein